MLDGSVRRVIAIETHRSEGVSLFMLEGIGAKIPYEDVRPREYDPADVESWLAGEYDYEQQRPFIELATLLCNDNHQACSCPHCYEVRHVDLETGRVINAQHFKNNAVCRCATKGCCSAR